MSSQTRGALPHRNSNSNRNVAPPSGSRQNGQVYADQLEQTAAEYSTSPQPRGALPQRNVTNTRNVVLPSGSRQNGQGYADPRMDPRRIQRAPPVEEDDDDDEEEDESSDEEDDSDEDGYNAPQTSRGPVQNRPNTTTYTQPSQNQAQRQISAQQQIYSQQSQRSSASQQQMSSDQQTRYSSRSNNPQARRPSGNVPSASFIPAAPGSSSRAGDLQSRYPPNATTEPLHPRGSGIGMPANVASSSARPPDRDSTAYSKTPTLAWSSNDLTESDIVLQLTPADVQEIAMAVMAFKRSKAERNGISIKTFPLSKGLSQKLGDISKRIHNGPGLAVIRGLEPLTYNAVDSATAFAGVCAHVCPERAQHVGIALDHVFDASHLANSGKTGPPGSKTADKLDHHADRYAGDVLAMFVQDPGAPGDGGDQFVVSFATIYNEIAARAPNMINILAAGNWPFEEDESVQDGPVIYVHDGRVICQLVRAPLLGTAHKERRRDSPALNQAQAETLEAVHRLAVKHQFQLPQQRGDIQLINNLGVMHARASFANRGARGPSSRHLLRMFLRDPKLAWRKPPSYEKKFNKPFVKSSSARPGVDMIPAIPVFNFDDPWKLSWGMEMHG